MKNHLLIAGVTGSGKSYLENQIIKKLSGQFIYIDPKMVELADYEGQPTCKRYAADIDEIIDALDDAIAEMDSRFTVMRAREEKLWTGSYLYIVIDELADLMLSDRKKTIRQQLATLATKGRAARVILICCTQVTTQDVIPQMILVNLPNVICLRQRNAQKYRYLLGEYNGKLPEYGVCFLVTPDRDRPQKTTTETAIETLIAQE